jgi:hypothetical protein
MIRTQPRQTQQRPSMTQSKWKPTRKRIRPFWTWVCLEPMERHLHKHPHKPRRNQTLQILICWMHPRHPVLPRRLLRTVHVLPALLANGAQNPSWNVSGWSITTQQVFRIYLFLWLRTLANSKNEFGYVFFCSYGSFETFYIWFLEEQSWARIWISFHTRTRYILFPPWSLRHYNAP